MESPIAPTDFAGFVDTEEDGGPSDDVLTKRIASVWARVRKLAPCLADEDTELPDDDAEIVRDTMRNVILRWIDRGSGAIYSEVSGDYSQTLATDRALFQPAEVREIQALCPGSSARAGKAYTAPTWEAEPAPEHHPFVTGDDVW